MRELWEYIQGKDGEVLYFYIYIYGWSRVLVFKFWRLGDGRWSQGMKWGSVGNCRGMVG